MYGESPLGDVAYGDFDLAGSAAVADALEALLAEPWRERSWWLRARPATQAFSFWVDEEGDIFTDEAGVPFAFTDATSTVPVDLSTDGHQTYPDDEEHFQLAEALVIPYGVEFGLEGLWGHARMSTGEIVWGNPRGERSALAGLDWVGREADVYVGPRRGRMAQFARVGRLVTRSVHFDRSTQSLVVDDYGFLFDRQIQSVFYAGTGGLEGDASIKGQPKPLLFGSVRQFEPVLVNGPLRIFELAEGSYIRLGSTPIGTVTCDAAGAGRDVYTVSAVRDKGIPLSFNAAVGDITASVPPPGTYNVSLVTGSSPYGYVETIAGLLKLLAVGFAGLSDPGDLAGAKFDALAAHTAVMGHWTGTTPQTILDAMDVFHRSAASWGWLRPDRIYTAGRITDPDGAVADVAKDADRDGLRESPWEVLPYEVPVGRVRVGYRRYPRTMTDAELAGAVPEETRRDYGQEYRFAVAENPQVFVDTPEAAEVTILTQLDTEAAAQALATEQLALRQIQRWRATFAPRAGLIKYGIGSVLSLTDARLPASPKQWVLTGVTNRAERSGEADQILWRCFG